jgi:predicted transposase/invertase (TIGR01784 family)
MTNTINPRVDIAFKKLFGVEENKDLLISLINATVGKKDQIVEVTLLNPYNPRNFRDDKLTILDIKAKGTDDKRYNIEIQISDEADYDKRALYYWAKLYTEQLQAGEDYSKLSKAISIHILNFVSILDSEKYHNIFHIKEDETGHPYFHDLELHTIELKKFSKNNDAKLSDIVAKIKNSLDMWAAFLTRHDLLNKEQLPKELDKAELKKALNILNIMNFAPDEREAYEEHLKWLRVEANTLKKYESKGFVEGKTEGREEGRAEGRAEGKTEGREEGIPIGEAKKSREIAIKMWDNGIPIDDISNMTGLSETEIKMLIEESVTEVAITID